MACLCIPTQKADTRRCFSVASASVFIPAALLSFSWRTARLCTLLDAFSFGCHRIRFSGGALATLPKLHPGPLAQRRVFVFGAWSGGHNAGASVDAQEQLRRGLHVSGFRIYWPIMHISGLRPAILTAWAKPLGRLVTIYRKNQLWNLSLALSAFYFVGPFRRLSEFLPDTRTGRKFGGVRRADCFGRDSCFHFVALLRRTNPTPEAAVPIGIGDALARDPPIRAAKARGGGRLSCLAVKVRLSLAPFFIRIPAPRSVRYEGAGRTNFARFKRPFQRPRDYAP